MYTRLGLVALLVLHWLGSVALFWYGIDPSDALFFTIFIFGLSFPLINFVVCVLWGLLARHRWSTMALLLGVGLSYMGLEAMTFQLANILTFDHLWQMRWELFFLGVVIAGVGLGLGMCVRRWWKKKS